MNTYSWVNPIMFDADQRRLMQQPLRKYGNEAEGKRTARKIRRRMALVAGLLLGGAILWKIMCQ